MKLMFIFVGAFLFESIQCDSGSFESSHNGIELNPFYDAIIISDIADIMKEIEHSNIPSLDILAKDESESDENVEDLLSEYQKHLEKEQKQRKDYIERTKLKNKVPLLRHERFSKTSFGNGGKYNDYLYKNGYYSTNTYKSKSPLDFFIPVNPKVTTTPPRNSMELNTFKKNILSESGLLPSSFPKYSFKSPCCKNGQMNCKQCGTAQELPRSRLEPKVSLYAEEKNSDTLSKIAELTDPDDALNIRIKIDVQLPKIYEKLERHQNRGDFDIEDGSNMKDFPLAIKMPTSYYDFPIPMNLFGYKRVSKLTSSPLHKMTVHKKKKSKSGSGSKKHRKKIITFHNIKLAPQEIYEAHFGKHNISEDTKNENNSGTVATESEPSITEVTETNFTSTATTPVEEREVINKTRAQTEENIFLLVNISNNVIKDTGECNKTNNSIEAEYKNDILNVTTETSLHMIKKREVEFSNKTHEANKAQEKVIKANKTVPQINPIPDVTNTSKYIATAGKDITKADKVGVKPGINITRPSKVGKKASKVGKKASKVGIKASRDITKASKDNSKIDSDSISISKNSTKTSLQSTKKIDKNLPNEEELLFWPNNNGSQSKIISKNITTIIIESENKKAKINMTTETMRNDPKRALEKAIFGDVDWNDVDTIAPAFMSFVGKYIEGALTICSNNICHSMKCGQKVCYHRLCVPKDRLNNKGHCMAANNTDSVATMESIMDLPSNVAFEIVDILQDKMAGKMFGKVTLCINSKCITFTASKKMFIKNKCIVKELNSRGHCVYLKEGKVA